MIADALFYAVCAGLLTLGLLRYFRVPLAAAIPLAVGFFLATGCILTLIFYARRKKKLFTKREREEREALMLHLALEKEERVRAALLAAFLADGKSAHCSADGVDVDGKLVIPLFTMQPVSADDVARLLRAHGNAPFTLACNALTPEAEKLLLSFGRDTMCADEIYTLFTRTGTTPSPLICGEIPRKTARQKLRRTFAKENARPFFVSGALLLIMSLFTLFPTYYLITGGILLCSSALIRALGYA